MSKDIRIATSFIHHPKTIKLRTRLGAEGLVSLISLWAFAGEYRPKGRLKNMSDEDIAIASQWAGDPAELIKVLDEIGWIDSNNGDWILHDWEEHNGYAFYADERKERAKNAAAVRWGNKDNANSNAGSNAGSIAKRNAPSPAPKPAPSPSPTPKRFTPPSVEEVKEYILEKGYSIDPNNFVDFYESKGWMVGRNKMKAWKAAVRNWATRNKTDKKTERITFDENGIPHVT